MRIKYCLLAILVLWAVGAVTVGTVEGRDRTSAVLTLSDGGETYFLNDYMEVLEDQSGQWTLQDVQSPDLQRLFQRADGKASFGYTESAYWIRVVLRNQSGSSRWQLTLQNPLIDYFNLYTSAPVESVRHHYPAYSLQLLPADVDTTVYMRLKTTGSFILPLQLTEPAAVYKKTSTEFMMYGLYYGVILTIIIYMLSLYINIRNRAYIYYILYILCYSASQFIWDGLALQFFGRNWFTAVKEGELLFASPASTYEFFFIVSVGFGYLATWKILQPAAFAPFLNRVFLGVILLCPLAAVGNAFLYTYDLAPLWIGFKIFTIVLLPIVLIGCALRGSRLAKHLTIAIVPLFAIAFPSSMLSTGVLPHNLFTHYGMQFGSVIEFIIMSIVLYEQVSQMRRKQHQVQKELADTLSEWNRTLNIKVAEQTESLKRSNDELVFAEQSRIRLLQNIAHDIRNPLNYVQGSIQALQQGLVQEPERQQKILDNVYGKVIEVNRFIDEMNHLEDTEGSKMLEMVMFAEWIDDIFQEMSEDIRHAGLQCETKVSIKEDADVWIAPHAMKRVMANLVHNACKFTPTGGRIKLEALQDEEWVRVTVEDNGKGIETERLPFIFHRYYKEDSGQGQGLGLAIAKEIIERHGGRIDVHSVVGEGSHFSFIIPKVQ
ncbi:7TM diverse intracellular signaling domain-containing protein [Paenibacillus sp. GCM10012307]|uniref:histidine kinase n=1 Tax=Paenibacillus roseus TaxID=2798579 RepID=A0A934IW44_9BACL|nr:sensor histidine kinase [Paenibacillus roseus]MBJ6360392.1 sensor histidine kinase [Paenibacillus roseus]